MPKISPLILLYAMSESFRKSVNKVLGLDENLFGIVDRKEFLDDTEAKALEVLSSEGEKK